MNPTRGDDPSDRVDAASGKGVMFVAEGLRSPADRTPFRT